MLFILAMLLFMSPCVYIDTNITLPLLLATLAIVRRSRPMRTTRFRRPWALSSDLATVWTVQPRALGLLNPLHGLAIYYIPYIFPLEIENSSNKYTNTMYNRQE